MNGRAAGHIRKAPFQARNDISSPAPLQRSFVEAIKADFPSDRVSLAIFDRRERSFRIAASAGWPLLEIGAMLPISASTLMEDTFDGRVCAKYDFGSERGSEKSVDLVMAGIGFCGGVSIPVFSKGPAVGALSISILRRNSLNRGDVGRIEERLANFLSSHGDVCGESLPDHLDVSSDSPRAIALSRREAEILSDLERGLRFKQIAANRLLSIATAKFYSRGLFRKLNVHSRAEAVFEARRRGLI